MGRFVFCLVMSIKYWRVHLVYVLYIAPAEHILSVIVFVEHILDLHVISELRISDKPLDVTLLEAFEKILEHRHEGSLVLIFRKDSQLEKM